MPAPVPAGNDPFGAPAPEFPPADAAAPAGDDLFGAPAAPADAAAPAPAGEDLFGAPPAAEPPAAPAGDDLFGAPPAADAPPAAGDDLFGPPAGAPAGDDLFGKPTSASEPAPANLDDLFGTPAESAPKAEAPAAESDPFADAFKSTRVWRDNTGSFEVTAVLAEIHTDKVRLLKDNGKYTTVPMRRLSTEDRQLVETIASQLPAGQIKFVSTK